MANSIDAVAEFQGLYGPFTVAERVLQKIWLHRDFDSTRMHLTDGRRLEIVSPGEWNLLGGPDFHGAVLRIDGREVRGDVEVHFHASDWRAHGHTANPTFRDVVLHVLLFPPAKSELAVKMSDDDGEMPALVLLPLLHRDLEEYAADDALETITARDEWRRFAELGRKSTNEILSLLKEKAAERWRQKVHYAKLRIGKLGWQEAAHQTALEILGYRRNRTAMLALATRFPLAAWTGAFDVEHRFEEGRALWQLHGVRPANHPRTRLRQYAAWVNASPDWPDRLLEQTAKMPAGEPAESAAVGDARKKLALPNWRTALQHTVAGEVVGGTRFETLVCDGFLPLAAAQTGRDLSVIWFNWFLGDVPLAVRQAMPRLGVVAGRARPFCHGYAQGLLAWILEQQAGAST